MNSPKNNKIQFILMKCPFGCNHHTFPNHFKFCPYCGSKLENIQDTPIEHKLIVKHLR